VRNTVIGRQGVGPSEATPSGPRDPPGAARPGPPQPSQRADDARQVVPAHRFAKRAEEGAPRLAEDDLPARRPLRADDRCRYTSEQCPAGGAGAYVAGPHVGAGGHSGMPPQIADDADH